MNNVTITPVPFSHTDSQFVEQMTLCSEIWNNAAGDDLAISNRVWTWLEQFSDDTKTLWLAQQGSSPVGFLLSSQDRANSAVRLDGLAVLPSAQRQGIGRSLIDALQTSLITLKTETKSLHVGGGPCSLLDGAPLDTGVRHFFERCGFFAEGAVMKHGTLAVATYQPPATLLEIPAAIHPAQAGQKTEILNFLVNHPQPITERLLRFVQTGRRISDLMLLWTENGMGGICQLGFEDSPLPIELSFPYRLPRPWAQIGKIFLSDAIGDEYQSAMIDASLRRLHNTGVNSALFTAPIPQSIREQFAIQQYQSFQPMVKQ